MKKFKRIVVLALSALFVLAACSSLAACTPPEAPKPDVSITVASYDTTKGTVTLDKSSYKQGDQVKVNITSKDGYEIKSIYVGNNNVTETVRQGNYEFSTAEYKFTASVAREIRVEFQEYGVWKNADYVWTLTIGSYDTTKGAVTVSPDRARYARDEQVTVTVTAAANYIIKSFKINGVEKKAELSNGSYTFSITDDTTVDVVLDDDLSIITYATLATFDDLISRDGKVFVDFYADWCGPCVNYMAPQLSQLAANYAAGDATAVALDVKIVKVLISDVNYNNFPEYALFEEWYSIYNPSASIPFCIMFEDGEVIGTLLGAYSYYEQLINWMQNPSIAR